MLVLVLGVSQRVQCSDRFVRILVYDNHRTILVINRANGREPVFWKKKKGVKGRRYKTLQDVRLLSSFIRSALYAIIRIRFVRC